VLDQSLRPRAISPPTMCGMHTAGSPHRRPAGPQHGQGRDPQAAPLRGQFSSPSSCRWSTAWCSATRRARSPRWRWSTATRRGQVARMFWQEVGPRTPDTALACRSRTTSTTSGPWAAATPRWRSRSTRWLRWTAAGCWSSTARVAATVRLEIGGLMASRPPRVLAEEFATLFAAGADIDWNFELNKNDPRIKPGFPLPHDLLLPDLHAVKWSCRAGAERPDGFGQRRDRAGPSGRVVTATSARVRRSYDCHGVTPGWRYGGAPIAPGVFRLTDDEALALAEGWSTNTAPRPADSPTIAPSLREVRRPGRLGDLAQGRRAGRAAADQRPAGLTH